MLPVDWLRPFDGVWERERPLAPSTTWRIGGPAELWFEPRTVEELSAIVAALWRQGIPWRVLGGGSNLLVPDRGVRGGVLSLRRMQRIEVAGERLVAEAGAPLHSVVHRAQQAGLLGAEALAGIPGHVGGAIFGNAGGRYGDIGSRVEQIDFVGAQGEPGEVRPGEGSGFFAYRSSLVGDRIVVRTHLKLSPGEPGAVREETRRIIRERRASQPGWVGNAGCVFKNPPGHSAGRLIDLARLKGTRVGGICVSPIHANFFENDGRGSADDVARLVDVVQERVSREHGVALEVEVRRWV